jgi:hypothetical protein
MNQGESEENGKGVCVYIKNWFIQIFPLFLTWLFRKLKFLISVVHFSPIIVY